MKTQKFNLGILKIVRSSVFIFYFSFKGFNFYFTLGKIISSFV